jgi:hypothetical protein
MMEDARQEEECSHELYLEHQYLTMRRSRRNNVTNDPQAEYITTKKTDDNGTGNK